MSAEENKAAIRRFLVEGINGRRLDVLDEVFAPDFVWHGGSFGDVVGLDEFKAAVGPFFLAFPDLALEVRALTAEEDRVAAHFTVSATHEGEFAGVAATGRKATWDGHPLYRFEGGRVVEEWFFEDYLTLFQQLGSFPAPTG